VNDVRPADVALGVLLVGAAWLAVLGGIAWLLDGGAVALLGPTVLAGLGGLAVLVLGLRVRERARYVGGPRMVLHTHGNDDREVAAWHEAGHVHTARHVRGKVTGAAIHPDGSGVTYLRLPRGATPIERVAVDVSGEVASGTADGCGSDHRYMRQVLASVPSSARGEVKAGGYALARRVCTRSALRSTATRLLERGRL
jgi:hypothetical protein